MSAGGGSQPEIDSAAEKRVRQYMLNNESIATSIRVRPTGFIAWIKSLFGIGVTHWFVTNQRLIEDKRFWGGFTFSDIPHEKNSSIEYGSKVPLGILGLGILLVLGGFVIANQLGDAGAVVMLLGLVVIVYAFIRRKQVLVVRGSGGIELSLVITKGTQVDRIILYLHAARNEEIHS